MVWNVRNLEVNYRVNDFAIATNKITPKTNDYKTLKKQSPFKRSHFFFLKLYGNFLNRWKHANLLEFIVNECML